LELGQISAIYGNTCTQVRGKMRDCHGGEADEV